ncbi:MAG: hypothetical protein Q7W51_01950 [Coriobacteriia bacterium]|nr:hypothetical protein [Coriobacteriia bacterium]
MHEFIEHLIKDHEKQLALGERLKSVVNPDERKEELDALHKAYEKAEEAEK